MFDFLLWRAPKRVGPPRAPGPYFENRCPRVVSLRCNTGVQRNEKVMFAQKSAPECCIDLLME
jgi:hypothetical protein